ncbi:MAG: hypothetical protein AAF605_03770 [Myxococcota bacterium]
MSGSRPPWALLAAGLVLGTGCIADDVLRLGQELDGPVFLESDGRVVIEAESYSFSLAGSGDWRAHRWTRDADTPGEASGTGTVVALPDLDVGNASPERAPSLAYRVRFERPGTYRIWLRMWAVSGNDNSVIVGFDGVPLNLERWGARLAPPQRPWGWIGDDSDDVSSEPLRFRIDTPGERIFQMWMREDGVTVDKIVLSDDGDFVPDGLGPPESLRE